jgi:3',5'-cyclic-AMP phosphodiesterase
MTWGRWVRHALLRTRLIALCVGLMSGLGVGCMRPAEERAQADEAVGRSTAHGLTVDVEGGMAAVQAHAQGEVTLWAQAPTLQVRLQRLPMGDEGVRLVLRNVLPDASAQVVTADGLPLTPDVVERPLPTVLALTLRLPDLADVTVSVAPPDAADTSPWRFAVLSDIQGGIDVVEDIYRRMNEDPSIRFVISSGDLVNEGTEAQLVTFQEKLQTLGVPFYSTMGNHEVFDTQGEPWPRIFGRSNVHFTFKGVAFSLVDSANATVDPTAYGWLGGWLDANRDAVHVFVTHYAPLDPVGPRNASFKSRREAAKLLKLLAQGSVDVAFFGHIHSFYQFSSANIPSYISGGGGALPEAFDGIARHYLAVDVEPSLNRVSSVGLVRIE